LRKAIDNRVDDRVVWRRDKKGFVTPQKEWKNELSKELSEYIHSVKIPEFIDKDYIIEQTDMQLNSSSDLSTYWKMISIIKWIDINNIL